jgi:hypothetical protein
MRLLWLVIFNLFLCVLSSDADARCLRPRLNWSVGDVLTTNWTVNSGDVCAFTARGRSMAMYAIEFPVTPKHGTLGTAERYAIAYRAANGYKGSDYFVFSVVGKQDGRTGTVTVKVNVTVD